jgi:3-hydroxyisobutyrate dehydrogenase
MNIGFIGLGQMGAPMARNLITKGHSLWVHDLNHASVAELVAQGAQAATGLAHIAQSCEFIITMLPAPAHVRQTYLGDVGLLAMLSAGTTCVDCSTIDPATAQDVAAAAVQRGVRFADAPVSGGTGGAAAGSLTFMVGVDAAHLDGLQSVLQAMGQRIVHCGAPGMGQVAKLCNNLLLGISMAGVAEAMNLGQTLGMQASTLANIINHSTGRCWSSEVYNPVPGIVPTAPASRGYSGGFGTRLMHKDLSLAIAAAQTAAHPTWMGAQARALYEHAIAQGLGGLDFSAVIGLYAPMTTVPQKEGKD